MSKVYESDVDPDEFIRSFREESSQSTVKKENENKAETPTRPSDSKRRKVQSQPLPEEDEYLDTFVRNMEHMRPLCKYLMVDIHPDFIRKDRKSVV